MKIHVLIIGLCVFCFMLMLNSCDLMEKAKEGGGQFPSDFTLPTEDKGYDRYEYKSSYDKSEIEAVEEVLPQVVCEGDHNVPQGTVLIFRSGNCPPGSEEVAQGKFLLGWDTENYLIGSEGGNLEHTHPIEMADGRDDWRFDVAGKRVFDSGDNKKTHLYLHDHGGITEEGSNLPSEYVPIIFCKSLGNNFDPAQGIKAPCKARFLTDASCINYWTDESTVPWVQGKYLVGRDRNQLNIFGGTGQPRTGHQPHPHPETQLVAGLNTSGPGTDVNEKCWPEDHSHDTNPEHADPVTLVLGLCKSDTDNNPVDHDGMIFIVHGFNTCEEWLEESEEFIPIMGRFFKIKGTADTIGDIHGQDSHNHGGTDIQIQGLRWCGTGVGASKPPAINHKHLLGNAEIMPPYESFLFCKLFLL